VDKGSASLDMSGLVPKEIENELDVNKMKDSLKAFRNKNRKTFFFKYLILIHLSWVHLSYNCGETHAITDECKASYFVDESLLRKKNSQFWSDEN